MHLINDKNMAIIALTIIASVAMFVFKNEAINIVVAIVAGILGLTNTLNQGK